MSSIADAKGVMARCDEQRAVTAEPPSLRCHTYNGQGNYGMSPFLILYELMIQNNEKNSFHTEAIWLLVVPKLLPRMFLMGVSSTLKQEQVCGHIWFFTKPFKVHIRTNLKTLLTENMQIRNNLQSIL